MTGTILWQRVEGALVFAAGLALFAASPAELSWGWALALFFAPDLSFAAYAVGPRAGAAAYNAVHLYALGALCLALGVLLAAPLIGALGALWLGHSGFDRMLGYGLKSRRGFNETHLGRIGRAQLPR